MDIMKYIAENMIPLIPAMWIVGTFLKRTPKVPNWLIPWVLLVFGVIAGIFVIGPNIEAVVQGVFVAGAAVLGHQLLKQTIEKG